SDVAESYSDIVSRFLGEQRPLRFVNFERPSFIKRLFGGK
ncbi:MAG: septum site-determining protein MinD, partial [Proteobacteria bacterium]|nr:septum site-determining protein MinD [Pseudomonadota bacterium]